MSSLINSRLIPTRGSPKRKRGSKVALKMVHHQTRQAHIHQSMHLNHGTACVNLMERPIASSAQRTLILPMTIVQRRSWKGMTCTNGGTRKYGCGISVPDPLTSNSGQLAKYPDSPPLLPWARVSLSQLSRYSKQSRIHITYSYITIVRIHIIWSHSRTN
jgi:hypothetical protein